MIDLDNSLKFKNETAQTSIRLLTAILLIGLQTWFFYFHILDEAILRLTLNNQWPLPPVIFTIVWMFLALMTVDLIFKKRFSLFVAPAVYFVVFFTAGDALWSSELLWDRIQLNK